MELRTDGALTELLRILDPEVHEALINAIDEHPEGSPDFEAKRAYVPLQDAIERNRTDRRSAVQDLTFRGPHLSGVLDRSLAFFGAFWTIPKSTLDITVLALIRSGSKKNQ